jgi:hypothetical protein
LRRDISFRELRGTRMAEAMVGKYSVKKSPCGQVGTSTDVDQTECWEELRMHYVRTGARHVTRRDKCVAADCAAFASKIDQKYAIVQDGFRLLDVMTPYTNDNSPRLHRDGLGLSRWTRVLSNTLQAFVRVPFDRHRGNFDAKADATLRSHGKSRRWKIPVFRVVLRDDVTRRAT